jgi:hypothetical protein
MSAKKTYKIAIVEWIDTTGTSSWTSLELAEAERPSENVTIGLVLDQQKGHITIAQSLCAFASRHFSTDHVMVIPRESIKKITILKSISWAHEGRGRWK